MPLIPALLDESLIGELLPWDLYTARSVLVVRAGLRIKNAAHFAELNSRPLYRRNLDLFEHPDDQQEPSTRLRKLIHGLPHSLHRVRQPGFEIAIRHHARELLYLSRKNHDALLGLSRLLPMDDPAIRHCLLVSIVVIGLGRLVEEPERQLESLVCAALTMNIGALKLHTDLAEDHKCYNDSARLIIQHHPIRGIQLLEASGIVDELWLTAVRQHHENLDGSGYPSGLCDEAIDYHARLLRVADFYMAKISGRRNRPPKSAQFALSLLLLEKDREQLDTKLARLLLQRHGLYPSGTLVKLENQEVAVVIRNLGHCGEASHAMSFLRSRGRFLAFPVERDISSPGHGVTEILEHEAHRSRLPWEAFWRDWV
jgi:HD-GYP domain-containing protein (c-di-GMP phosphodiesterase class II)